MSRKNLELTSLVKEGAHELRGVVEQALAERPLLVLGLALELGLIAGHWARGGKVAVADIAKRALAASPQSLVSAFVARPKAQRQKVKRGTRKTSARKTTARKTTPRRTANSRSPGRKVAATG